MNTGQELTHTTTTVVTATHQQVSNETTLRDGEVVVLKALHEVNIPLGVTYDIAMQGDVNGAAVQRTFGVINRLIGQDAFSFTATNNATDDSLTLFTATYDPETMTFSGTAYFESIVRLIFEDGSSKKIVPNGDSTWSATISELDLEYGENNIVLVNGTNDDDIIVINVTRNIEVQPFNPDFTSLVNESGQTVSGTVLDSRATITVSANGVEVAEVMPKADLTWSYNFAPTLNHGALVKIGVKFENETVATQDHTFYKKTAQLDQIAGQSVSGLSGPDNEITATTDKYGQLTTFADADGNWSIDFQTGLPANAVVNVVIEGVALAPIAYTGPDNVVYALTLEILSSTELVGTAKPATLLSITAGQQATFTVLTDQSGKWLTTLETALIDGDVVSIVTPLSETVQATFTDTSKPTEPEPEFTAILESKYLIVGNEPDSLPVKAVINGTEYPAVFSDGGNWSIEFDPAIPNVTAFYVTNGQQQITLRTQYLEAIAVTTTQIDGIAKNGDVVTIGNISKQVEANGSWTIILSSPLKVGDSVSITTSSGDGMVLKYVPPYTAYLKSDGLTVFGSSPEPQVEIYLNLGDAATAIVDVVDGDWTYTFDQALTNEDSVLVKSGIESKTLTYSVAMTEFTAELNAELTLVTGVLSNPAKIRIVFDDNSMLEREITSGAYTFDLGRTLVVGEVIVVACITNNTMYDAKTIYAEDTSGA